MKKPTIENLKAYMYGSKELTPRQHGDAINEFARLQCYITELEEKFILTDVGSSLPSKKELLSISENIIEEKHKGLDELEKKYILLGFLYYHRYLYDKSNSR